MHSLTEIIHDISFLSEKEKKEALKVLKIEIMHDDNHSNLKQYRGIAKDIWTTDAQTCISEARSNDRI